MEYRNSPRWEGEGLQMILPPNGAGANADFAGAAFALLRRDKQFLLRVSGWRKSPAAWLSFMLGLEL